jgi:parallel beta-helix repeat protein
MKRTCWLLLLVCAVLFNIGTAMADGDMYVVAVGGGVGTKITSLPKTITAPGFYYVAGNLTCPSGIGITVNSDDVTIDLMGFRLSGNSASHGISGSTNNVEVRNGTLSGWNHAIDLWGTQCRIINLRAQGNSYGINLGTNGGHVIKGCTLKNNTDTGIFASDSTISNNVLSVSTGAFYAIVGDGIISGNRITGQHKWGIFCTGPANIIGNTVYSSSSGESNGGILLSDVVDVNSPTVIDQNTVYGPGPHYLGGDHSATFIWAGKSTLYPWGNNAGHE